jgi:AcrR family transcriptional regulator
MARVAKKVTRSRAKAPARDAFHHGDLEAAATNAAYRIVAEHGAEALNLRSVALSCGVDHSALYRHWANKDALRIAVAAKGFGALAAAITAPPASNVQDLLTRYAAFAVANPNVYALMFSVSWLAESRESQLQQAIDGITQQSARVMDPQFSGGAISPDLRDRVVRAWSLVHGLIDLTQRGVLRAKSPAHALAYINAQIAQMN